MDKAKLNLFDGAVSHRRVGNKKHQFEYKYKSAFVEDIYDFDLEKFKRINSKILSFADNYSDMSGKVIDSMKSFIERYKEAYKNQLYDFAKFVTKNIKPLAQFEDGRRALIMANAAKKSLTSKKFEKLNF